ncbi:WD repeat protein [Penicillium digitatum]|uniref:WD repeat protein n=3 Tax=Penicillium digitatum TaxID=36651 RepID=K9GIK2_PEND2|nr:WD repeat protein [Penicillium digitatum Pd1]EKV13036.1 WD repeat protein [Penicillium digitatum PHI26]EKV18729.1 WD repeat protein [Penicillium digitatum Pd1]QQK42771.1 WD repeat protein [Penicillium digitatum]
MSYGFSSPNGQGVVPIFPGLSARSIPENPDIQRETLRLLVQYSRVSSLPENLSTPVSSGHTRDEVRNAWQSSRTEVQPSEVSPLRTPYRFTRSSSGSRSTQPSPTRSVAPSFGSLMRLSSRTPFRLTSPQSVSVSISSSHDISPTHRERQRTLRESVAISNASRNDEIVASIRKQHSSNPPDTLSSASRSPHSRSVSPTAEQSSIRRSSRNRVQPINYYANPWFNVPLDSEVPEKNIESTPDTVGSSPQEPCRVAPRRANVQKLLYGRELGGGNHHPIFADVVSDLRPWKSWQGASGDLLVLAWSPDGTQFAAGAAAKSDEHNMQYNKPNNLLLGDLQSNSLKEIPDHWIPRPTSSTVDDPRLFMSVNNMEWIGNRLYTASFDKTVKIWDVESARNVSCTHTLQHESRVAVMSVSKFDPNILATGTETILVWDTRDPENLTSTLLPLDRDARYKPTFEFSSTALAWGNAPSTEVFLAGGLAEPGEDPIYKGHLGLWRARESAFETVRMSSNSQNVFDIKWHSSLPIFATASPEDPHNARIKGIGITTKSIVRVFSLNCDLHKRVPSVMEFSCPAFDVNDVSFCPIDSNGTYVTASCTDGKTYVWDNRKGDRILHELRHRAPLNPIDHQRSRETADVGVRVALWGSSMDQFYTGASDGVLKRWDIRRSPEDVLVEDIASFDEEIMCAAFTDDQSHLLVGGSGGGVHVLSSGPCSDPDIRSFEFEHAPEPEKPCDSGIVAGNQLVLSGQIVRHDKFGMGQGPSYTGPFASWARNITQGVSSHRIGQLPLLKKYQSQQLDGPPPEDRHDLDVKQRREVERQIQLAEIRNRGFRKRKCREYNDSSTFIFQGPIASLGSSRPEKKRKKKAEKVEVKKEDNQENCGENRGANKKEIAKKKSRTKKKVRRLSRRIISNTEDVDLTLLDSDTEMGMSNRQRFDFEELLEVLEEDNWFPASGEIDPNIQKEIV